MKEKLIACLRRALWALPTVLFGGYSLHRAFSGSNYVPEVAAWLLFAAAMLIVLAIQVAFPIAGVIGDWFSRIYMPAATETPPASYILADLYERERRWEQSMAEFEKIIHYHPEEIPAHLGRLRVAINGFGDHVSAEKFLHASLRKFHDAESQDAIRQAWEELRTVSQCGAVPATANK